MDYIKHLGKERLEELKRLQVKSERSKGFGFAGSKTMTKTQIRARFVVLKVY